MNRFRPSGLLTLLALLTLSGCGGSEAGADQFAPGESVERSAPGESQSSVSASASGDQLEIIVAGDRFAGTHQVEGDLTCMMYGGTWQAVYEDLEASGLSAMLVQLKGIPAAGGSSDQVTFTVTFGQMDDMSGTAGMLDVVGAEYGGDAQATVSRDGEGATMRVEGTPAQGGRVTAVLRCATVDLMR